MQLTLETGEIGRQANGAVMAKLGDTVSIVMRYSSPVMSSFHLCGKEVQVASGAIDVVVFLLQMLYTTACCSNEPAGDGSFLPLQVMHVPAVLKSEGHDSGPGHKRCSGTTAVSSA